MADTDTAPIEIRIVSATATSLEEFKKVFDGREATLLALNYRDGLKVYLKGRQEIDVPSGRISRGNDSDTKLAEEIFQHIGVPAHLIRKMKRKSSWRYHFLLWMPIQPVSTTFMDKMLGRSRQEWQLVVSRL